MRTGDSFHTLRLLALKNAIAMPERNSLDYNEGLVYRNGKVMDWPHK